MEAVLTESSGEIRSEEIRDTIPVAPRERTLRQDFASRLWCALVSGGLEDGRDLEDAMKAAAAWVESQPPDVHARDDDAGEEL